MQEAHKEVCKCSSSTSEMRPEVLQDLTVQKFIVCRRHWA